MWPVMALASTPQSSSKALVFVRRGASTVTLWGLVCAVFFSHQSWAFIAFIGLLAVVATVEYFKMLRTAGVACFPRFGLLLAVSYCLALYWFYLAGHNPRSWLDPLAFFVALAGGFALQMRQPIRRLESLVSIAVTVLGFGYIAFLSNFMAHLLFVVPDGLSSPGRVSSSGAFLLLWLLAVTKFTDMGAYITGSLMGRHKMIPHISPAKTWEGFGGALLFAQLAGCGLFYFFPDELACLGGWTHVVILGLVLAILAVTGDLAESIVKRALDAKDSGRILPGIGGSLDLIDSVCFTAPALYFYLKWFLLPVA
jgi:phosphatidate cytidylyltransferase